MKMEKVMILFVIALGGCNAIFIDESSNRISNGQETSITNFPYLISMQRLSQVGTPTRGHICGGALFTLTHVLTAATCGFEVINGTYVPINNADYRIFAGATLLTDDNDPNRIRTIANFTVHPDYIFPPASLHDIAVITLNAPYASTTVMPLALPASNFSPQIFTLCKIASWGGQSYDETASIGLRFTTKFVFSQNLCAILYNQIPLSPNIFPSMICAASFDIISSGCHGDLGIPLACDMSLTGIMFQTNGCNVSSFPEVYTRVSNYTYWIRTISGSSAVRPELPLFGVLTIIIAKFVTKV